MSSNEASGFDLDLPAPMFRSGEDPTQVTLTMWRRRTGLQNTAATFTVIDGRAIVDGDILLGPADQVRTPPDDGRGIGITGEDFRWPDGIVPYLATDQVTDRVDAAIAHWEKHTPIRFVTRTDETDFISFESLNGCFSSVGMQGGEQTISLGAGCSVGSAIHEIGHALGLWHEQSRADRDNFIQIIFANISPLHRHNFDRHVLDGTDLGDYDFGSIMHYPRTAFSINGQPTILTKDGQDIGQRNGLSPGDIASVRLLYPNLDWGPQDRP
jgi:Astacin (Peptidase family M12A)